MFHADLVFVFAILTLVAGAYLVLNTKIHKEISTTPCKIIGYIAVILSILMLLISGYGMIRKYTMHRSMMQQDKMMMDKKCMQKCMKKNKQMQSKHKHS